MPDFSRSLSNFQIIAKNFDWFIALLAPVVIGQLARVKMVSTQKCDTLMEFYFVFCFFIFRQWLYEPGNQSVQFEWRKSQHHKVS